MDKLIYERVCSGNGHSIVLAQESLLDPGTNATVPVTSKYCTKCGGVDEELAKTPSGFAPKKKNKEEAQ